MDYAFLMGVFDCFANAAKQTQSFTNVKTLCVAISIKRCALDVLHHEIGLADIGCSTVDQAGNIRMVECGEYLSFVAKAEQYMISVHTPSDQFDGNLLTEHIVR